MPKISFFKKFITKLANWEYWPFSLLYLPVFAYYGWLALKCRSFFFFTASNPSIEFAGMFGERKSRIYDIIPDKYIPTTFLIDARDEESAMLRAKDIGYPLIAKPDTGERGTWVKMVRNEQELSEYARNCPVPFLVQEQVGFPVELGVFFVKCPGAPGRVTSIVRKDFLKIKGDGQSTIRELLLVNERAVMTADFESCLLNERGDDVLAPGRTLLVEPIGNHCRGTMFLDDNHEINDELNAAFNRLSEEIPGFYFGRFDLRCASFDDLKNLRNFKIMELNGAGSEPSHIYQPGYSLFKAYKDLFWHLNVLAEISRLNHKNGVPYWKFRDGYKMWKSHQKHNRLLRTT